MDYKTLHSLDNESIMLISQEIEGTTETLYQVIKGGSVELSTLDKTKAVRTYKRVANELIKIIRQELQVL